MQGQVSLDSVEFADGGILGPDRMGYIALERLKEAFENDVSTRSQNVAITDDQFVGSTICTTVHFRRPRCGTLPQASL
jgi:hypothetical protein